MRARLAAASLVVVLAAGAALAAAQAPVPAPPPASPHSGGFTPFRDGSFAGTSIDTTTLLEQPDSPIRLSLDHADRNERGLTLSLRLENLANGASTRQVLGAWVITRDGTVKGYQRFESKRAIPAGEARTVEFTIRHATTNTVPGDLTIVAVQESAGAPAWRQDQASLQKAVRAAVVR